MDSKVASRLISTVLCGRIVPGVIMHERFDDDRKACVLDVVDGKQRLTTLYTFKRGVVHTGTEMGAQHCSTIYRIYRYISGTGIKMIQMTGTHLMVE